MLADDGPAVGAGVQDDLAVLHGEGDQATAQPASVGHRMKTILQQECTLKARLVNQNSCF